MKIAFALIAHENEHIVARLIRNLLSQGHTVAIHYDLNAAPRSYERLVQDFAGHADVVFARRFRVGWGEWSIVEATLSCLEAIDTAGWEPDYVYLLSGADYPIRPSAQLSDFLQRNIGDEFIESVPSDTVKWVKSGPQRERYEYRWYFNWRRQPRLSDYMFNLQKSLGLRRRFVRRLVPHMGSQWWVLTWPTLKAIMALAHEPDIVAFFRTTLVPDELFFQTLVRVMVPDEKIIGCPLTFYQFSDYGYPVIYYADHLDYLLRQKFFMARKLSAHDMTLRDRLDEYWAGKSEVAAFDDEDVGLRTSEYNDWRLAYRDGPPKQPVVAGAGKPWAEKPKSLTKPYFAVFGTSTAELRLVQKCLAGHPSVVLHGQLFHPTRIEFAEARAHCVGYETTGTPLRDFSPASFLTDVMRAERERMSGFMLRLSQGSAISETMMHRADVRIILVRGDPLIGFAEDVLGSAPLLEQRFNAEAFARVPPAVAANRFREFLKDYNTHVSWLNWQANKAVTAKPKGWIARLNFVGQCRDWSKRLEACLGLALADRNADLQFTEDVQAFEEIRAKVVELLIAGGIDPVVLETLEREADNPAIALALV